MKSVQLYKEHLQQFVSAEELANLSEELLKAKETLVSGSGKGNDFLGWIDLPKEISPDIIDKIKKEEYHEYLLVSYYMADNRLYTQPEMNDDADVMELSAEIGNYFFFLKNVKILKKD